MSFPPDRPLPRRQLPALPVETPRERWKRRALEQAPILRGADWIQVPAYRAEDPPAGASVKIHIERVFRHGFPENGAKVSVGAGMSTGGVACAKSWEGARKYLREKGQYFYLVAAEGFYLPSVDRQNRSYEIMSPSVHRSHVLAAARIDEIDYEYNQLMSCASLAVCFNHSFAPPQWLDKAKLQKRLDHYVEILGGRRRLDLAEYNAVRLRLGFPTVQP